MRSTSPKTAKNPVIYSVLASDFELPDFKNDALAGVRANYFNSRCAAQSDKTEINIDGRLHKLSYVMERAVPLSWKMTRDNLPAQTVKRASDGSYSVISYGENGVIFKRQYFDPNHFWLRTEYYDRALENRIAAVLYPKRADGLTVLRFQRFLPAGIESRDLYPSMQQPEKRCAALVYSNAGMLWYDEENKPGREAEATAEKAEGGFRFSGKSFAVAGNGDPLGLKNAEYLSESDITRAEKEPEVTEVTENAKAADEAETAEAEKTTEAAQPAPEAYSAYERIESILFEAQKTNKNIFGISEEPQEEPLPEQETEREQTKEADLRSDAETEQHLRIEPQEEPAPDSVISTKNGVYTYYGSLDEKNRRSGRGRTVTPDGLTAYDGEYLADKRDGFGVCYYKEGSPNYFGNWQEGNRSGGGVGFRLSDGTMHAGRWKDNKPDGFGARFNREGDFLDVCTYVGGKRNGKSVSFDADGNIVVRMWKDGTLVSEKIISD